MKSNDSMRFQPRVFFPAAICRCLPSALPAAVILLVFCIAPVTVRAFSVEQMTTNGRANPLGIAADDISFAWAIAPEARGVIQSAYRIRVSTEGRRRRGLGLRSRGLGSTDRHHVAR